MIKTALKSKKEVKSKNKPTKPTSQKEKESLIIFSHKLQKNRKISQNEIDRKDNKKILNFKVYWVTRFWIQWKQNLSTSLVSLHA